MYIQYIQQINAQMVVTFLCEISVKEELYISLPEKRSAVHFTAGIN